MHRRGWPVDLRLRLQEQRGQVREEEDGRLLRPAAEGPSQAKSPRPSSYQPRQNRPLLAGRGKDGKEIILPARALTLFQRGIGGGLYF